jgi:hypothetical protein
MKECDEKPTARITAFADLSGNCYEEELVFL